MSGILIEWNSTAFEGCRKNINYMITISRANSGDITTVMTTNDAEIVIQSLVPGQEYTVHVITVINSCTTGSTMKNFTTDSQSSNKYNNITSIV